MKPEVITTLQDDVLSFAELVARDLDGLSIAGQPYIQRMAHILTGVYSGTINRLILRAPPRHYKTKLMASSIAFELGHNPKIEVVWASYDEPIAAEAVDYIRDIIRLPWFAKVFPNCRLNLEHARSGDFRTTKGGGVRAIGIHGKVAAKGIDYFVADDVLDVHDWNNQAEIADVIKCLERIIPSRFNTPKEGRAVILGHLLNLNDPSSHFANKGWLVEALPFEAPFDQDIELGHGIWPRKKGELLRPNTYTEEQLEDLRKMVDPPYHCYFNQGVGPAVDAIKASDFRICERGRHGNEPIVLSVDTALRSGARHSYNVIQAWAFDGKNHLLREQFRERCIYEVLEERFYRMAKKLRCYAAIIEETSNGPPLIRFAQSLGIIVVPVKPVGDKVARLAEHYTLIQHGYVSIAGHLYPEFGAEVDDHPRRGTDQTDSCSQYLTHRPPPPPRLLSQRQMAPSAIVYAYEHVALHLKASAVEQWRPGVRPATLLRPWVAAGIRCGLDRNALDEARFQLAQCRDLTIL